MSVKKCMIELENELEIYGNRDEALIPCLHIAQEKCGCITEEVILFLAEKLKLPPVEVYSVVTFYSMFTLKKQGKYIIRVCDSLPCYLKGSKKILETLNEELGIGEGQTTRDKRFTIEAVSCLGLCDKAPAMMVNEKVYGNLGPAKVKKIISQLKMSKGKK